jgi:hypothetical protein
MTATVEQKYFEDIWRTELAAVDARRDTIGRPHVAPSLPPLRPLAAIAAPRARRVRSPDPEVAFARGPAPGFRAATAIPERVKIRPEPVPCDATGLALSGGGIRSAAVCLGALQALSQHKRLRTLDYLSTVSGGGYIGCCLSAAMSERGGRGFPFGDDVKDSAAVSHLRNSSNYLLPRGRSTLRNYGEAAAVLLRGLLANTVIAGSFVLALAMLTWLVARGGLAPRIGDGALYTAGLAAALLLVWAIIRSSAAGATASDTSGRWLIAAQCVLAALCLLVLIVAQAGLSAATPGALDWLRGWMAEQTWPAGGLAAVLTALSGVVSFFSSRIGAFLTTTQRSDRLGTTVKRVAMIGLVLLASGIVPVLLWIALLLLSGHLGDAAPGESLWVYLGLWAAGTLASLFLRANGFSLHRFYRDRLSAAFLFRPATDEEEMRPLDDIRLTDLRGGAGPYHIINAALNVQGSAEANRRGRGADFFIFTPDFVGSDLTRYSGAAGYASANRKADIDPALNLGTALAISGAAVSANMGSNTVRTLSPTLALLNVRLGYWLRNPRYLARFPGGVGWLRRVQQKFTDKLYLLREMFNLLDENSPSIYLTDGGHIENLGVYELLKRGCKTIIAIDAEADPELAMPSLLKLERYARIDFGIRITLPWEEIARMHRKMAASINDPRPLCQHGPHCALGRIRYADGQQGVLVYVKASMTGDEKDYLIDYKKRYPAFPHETTGDQFFTEEQFEAYRALGFHMVDGFFSRSDRFAFRREDFASADAAFAEVDESVYAQA